MKHRDTQLGARKNPDSPRVHGLRLSVGLSVRSEKPSRTPAEVQESTLATLAGEVPSLRLSEATHEVTERGKREKGSLLTVREVATFLRLPVSWVYEHTRQNCMDRIPGFRLGKYWRFIEEDVTAWLAARRTKDYHHARKSQ
jgi:excisionase family DNA binding protein